MFNNDIVISGKHANYIHFLNDMQRGTKVSFFERYIDILMIGAVIGFIYGRKEKTDVSQVKNTSATIFAETVIREKEKLKFIYRTILLLDDKNNKSEEERIERAFRDEYRNPERHKENMELFYSYARGGISILYEVIQKDAYNIEEYIKNLKYFLDDFHNDFILNKYVEEIIYDQV